MEVFSLIFMVYWMGALVVVLATKMYEEWGDVGYMTFAVILAAPVVVVPPLLVLVAPGYGPPDGHKPWGEQYWAKANVWIAIISLIGNWFWTHYFFNLLKAKYTIPDVTWELNGIPICLYIITHAYFASYFAFVTPILRKVYHATSPGVVRVVSLVLAILALAYFTAFAETLTIASFPYYVFEDRAFMYSVGSTFYALYFVVAFPMFARMDERLEECWSFGEAALDSFAACMIVFLLCDCWRLGALYVNPGMSSSIPYAQI